MSEATQAQAVHALPPGVDGRAMAPPPDTEESNYNSLAENEEFRNWLNRIGDFAQSQSNTPAQWERRRKSVKLRKYILGEYYGVFDKQRGWVSAKEEGDGIYFDPQTPTFIDSLVAQLVKSRPRKRFEARNPEMPQHREAARIAEKLIELDELNDHNPKRQQREWKWNLLAAGETYRITYFNTNKTGCGVFADKLERKMIPGGESVKYCPLCSSTAVDETGKCLTCHNPQMDEFTVEGTEIVVSKGKEYKQIGDVDWDSPDALEMTVIGDTDQITEALIVLRDRTIPRCVLEHALKIPNLPRTDIPDNLTYKQLFDHNREDQSEIREFEPLHYQEFWVAPAVAHMFKFGQDTPTQSGKIIKAGTTGDKLFPAGLYYSRVGKRITLVAPQSPSECLTHAVNSIGEGFHGHGEWDLAELQDQATEAKSMKMNSAMLESAQPLFVRTGYFDINSLENKFGLIVPVENLPNDINLDALSSRLKPSQPPGEAYQLGEEIKGQMQQRAGAFSTTSDAPDVKAMGTATGIATLSEQASGRRGPALQLYAQMEVEHAYQKLELRQKFWPEKMFEAAARDLGQESIKWFRECNIRRDISITVVPDSWMPRTDEEKQMRLQQYLALTGSIMAAKGDMKMLDEVLRKANEIFGADLDFGDTEKQSVEAMLRLDKLRDVAAFTESTFGEMLYAPDGSISEEAMTLAFTETAKMLRINHTPVSPQDIFADLPIDAMFDTHAEFEEAYTDWLRSAEGQQASPFLRSLVHKLAEYHIQAEAFRNIRMRELQNLQQVPDLNAGLIENEVSHAQQMEQQAQNTEQQLFYDGIAQAAAPPQAPAKAK